jgi:hypothetical protein
MEQEDKFGCKTERHARRRNDTQPAHSLVAAAFTLLEQHVLDVIVGGRRV